MSEPNKLPDTVGSRSGGPETESQGAVSPDQPSRIGRYRVVKPLGKGGFGTVYLAHDDDLNRPVAIKVPHRRRVSSPEDVEQYLAEARVVARLDHPGIVPVYDVGRTEDGLCYVVSKLIEGGHLAARIRGSRPFHIESAELVATVAEALHYAHLQRVVHRDIKPSNILMDASGKPYVCDFGLALKEEDFGKGAGLVGTRAYMSPEQARGEGHRADGRSDIFGLGVVFYELLAGRRPFVADTEPELFEQITTVEPRPPRQVDDTIPKELERICLKALSKRMSDRYTTAKDLADDLRHFIQQTSEAWTRAEGARAARPAPEAPPATPTSTPPPTPAATPTPIPTPITPVPPSSDRPVRIVPKGLRSFDAQDADFFLDLLPGPRDRDGLPESLRFWKTRVEEADPEQTFAVGLVYGPSGCGKSSLVKAGLLPRLADHVIVVYVEATAQGTEARLLRELRKHHPGLPDDLGLRESVAAIRRGGGVSAGEKVLIVLDQFEQWLHAHREEEHTELAESLRQCDGGRVQCLLTVRDDFWMAVTRFMRELEISLIEGQNSAPVDLFDLRHARKVLEAFGRAFGTLPEDASEPAKDQKTFLEQAVSGLAEDGKVICVHLALFAEMMKQKQWTTATLKEAGGTEGLGVTFLEETFSAQTAPPEHRLHQKAARAVLKALLPQHGATIRGHMRSSQELLEASGYARRPKDFQELLRILDNELRLVTPTDPEGAEPDGQTRLSAGLQGRYYQLTHDYLIPSLREWLTLKQKESRRGRVQIRLAERAGLWSAKSEARQLPSSWEWLSIHLLTSKRDWTQSQRKMMKAATWYHLRRGIVLVVLLACLGWCGVQASRYVRAVVLVNRLLGADMAEVPGIIQEMGPLRDWVDRLLRKELSTPDPARRLRASLGLVPQDEQQVEYLRGRLLEGSPEEVQVIRQLLIPHKDLLKGNFWELLESPIAARGQRLRAACALAGFEPDSERWSEHSEAIGAWLVSEDPPLLSRWIEILWPIREALVGPLEDLFNQEHEPNARRAAASALAEFLEDDFYQLVQLAQEADADQLQVIAKKLGQHDGRAVRLLEDELSRTPPSDASEDARETSARRRANAAMTLALLEHIEQVWPSLVHSADPRCRTYLIHRIAPSGIDPKLLIDHLDEERDASVKRALLLSLGEYKVSAFAKRQHLVERLLEMYSGDPDVGVHSAAEWLLRRLGQDKRLSGVNKELRAQGRRHGRQWYVDSEGHTMAITKGPVTFSMGSPASEAERSTDEKRHQATIDWTFAVSTEEVTIAQYRRFSGSQPQALQDGPDPQCPVVNVDYADAMRYCQWLSRREGIPEGQWCYDEQGGTIKPRPDCLSRTGYRLPTEAEWEYVCRAGAATRRHYGDSDEFLGSYAWYRDNAGDRAHPVGSLKPNDCGLFDVYGNVEEWCQNCYEPDPTASPDLVSEGKPRAIRGGHYSSPASSIRSARRFGIAPEAKQSFVGFRVARTLEPSVSFPEGDAK